MILYKNDKQLYLFTNKRYTNKVVLKSSQNLSEFVNNKSSSYNMDINQYHNSNLNLTNINSMNLTNINNNSMSREIINNTFTNYNNSHNNLRSTSHFNNQQNQNNSFLINNHQAKETIINNNHRQENNLIEEFQQPIISQIKTQINNYLFKTNFSNMLLNSTETKNEKDEDLESFNKIKKTSITQTNENMSNYNTSNNQGLILKINIPIKILNDCFLNKSSGESIVEINKIDSSGCESNNIMKNNDIEFIISNNLSEMVINIYNDRVLNAINAKRIEEFSEHCESNSLTNDSIIKLINTVLYSNDYSYLQSMIDSKIEVFYDDYIENNKYKSNDYNCFLVEESLKAAYHTILTFSYFIKEMSTSFFLTTNNDETRNTSTNKYKLLDMKQEIPDISLLTDSELLSKTKLFDIVVYLISNIDIYTLNFLIENAKTSSEFYIILNFINSLLEVLSIEYNYTDIENPNEYSNDTNRSNNSSEIKNILFELFLMNLIENNILSHVLSSLLLFKGDVKVITEIYILIYYLQGGKVKYSIISNESPTKKEKKNKHLFKESKYKKTCLYKSITYKECLLWNYRLTNYTSELLKEYLILFENKFADNDNYSNENNTNDEENTNIMNFLINNIELKEFIPPCLVSIENTLNNIKYQKQYSNNNLNNSSLLNSLENTLYQPLVHILSSIITINSVFNFNLHNSFIHLTISLILLSKANIFFFISSNLIKKLNYNLTNLISVLKLHYDSQSTKSTSVVSYLSHNSNLSNINNNIDNNEFPMLRLNNFGEESLYGTNNKEIESLISRYLDILVYYSDCSIIKSIKTVLEERNLIDENIESNYYLKQNKITDNNEENNLDCESDNQNAISSDKHSFLNIVVKSHVDMNAEKKRLNEFEYIESQVINRKDSSKYFTEASLKNLNIQNIMLNNINSSNNINKSVNNNVYRNSVNRSSLNSYNNNYFSNVNPKNSDKVISLFCSAKDDIILFTLDQFISSDILSYILSNIDCLNYYQTSKFLKVMNLFIQETIVIKYLENLEYFSTLLKIISKTINNKRSLSLYDKNIISLCLIQLLLYYNKTEIITKPIKKKISNYYSTQEAFNTNHNYNNNIYTQITNQYTNNNEVYSNSNKIYQFNNHDHLILKGCFPILLKLLDWGFDNYLIFSIFISLLAKSKLANDEAIKLNLYSIIFDKIITDYSVFDADYSYLVIQLLEKIAFSFKDNISYFEKLVISNSNLIYIFELLENLILTYDIGIYSYIVFQIFSNSMLVFYSAVTTLDKLVDNFLTIVEEFSFLNSSDFSQLFIVIDLMLLLIKNSNLRSRIVEIKETMNRSDTDNYEVELNELSQTVMIKKSNNNINEGDNDINEEDKDVIGNIKKSNFVILDVERINEIFKRIEEFGLRLREDFILEKIEEYNYKN